MRNIFICGIETLLGSCFAAQKLQNPENRVCFFSGAPRTTVSSLISHAASQMSNSNSLDLEQGIAERLQEVSEIRAGTMVERPAEFWWFVSAGDEASSTEFEKLLGLCSSTGAKIFNYVNFDTCSKNRGQIISDEEVSSRCAGLHLDYRIFRVSLITGSAYPRLEFREVLGQFFSILLSLKAEIEERSPQYFDFHALRWLGTEDVSANLMPANVAADLLQRIAGANGTTNASFSICNPVNTPLMTLCECISIACNMSLLPVREKEQLNAIDRIFHERLGSIRSLLTDNVEEPNTEACRLASVSPNRSLLDEEALIAIFELIRDNQGEALKARRRRAADLPSRLVRKVIDRNGSEFIYYTGTSENKSVPIIILNALGQGLEYWYRLLDNLMEDHPVIIWEPRGTVAPAPFSFYEQVDDLTAVVKHEGIESCHLIGWCTGPKVAIEFYLRQPEAVCSMVFLNATFKCDGGPEELDSPYEHNMESLCRMLVRKPGMAASVMNTLRASTAGSETEILEGQDREQISVNVLSQMNANLKEYVLAPFRTEETTRNYAHQLVDFWAHDVRLQASRVEVPVLLISAEYDQVAASEGSTEAANLFRDSRHVHVHGATHYCLYDRPEFTGALLKKFFATSGALPVSGGAKDQICHCVQVECASDERPAATAALASSRSIEWTLEN